MRATVGPILLHLLILLAGLGMLRLAGIVPRLWSLRALAAGGLAYLCGVAALMSLSILLLVIGGPFSLVTIVLICVLLASPLAIDVPALARTRRIGLPSRERAREWWSELGMERRLVALTVLVFLVLAIIGLLTLSGQPIDREAGFDTWNLWMRKASLLFFDTHLPTAVFKSPAEGYIQAYYPLGYSLMLAAHMRSMGVYETSTVHEVVWIMLLAFVWGGAFLASQVTRPFVWVTLLTGTVLLVYVQASSGYADIPQAIFLCVAVLATGIWLERRRRSDLMVACLLLAGAAQIKNEGFSGVIITLVVAFVYLLAQREWPALRELVVGGFAVVAVAILPWRIWIAANHISSDHSLGQTFDPSYLIHHFNRVGPSLKALESQISGQASTSVLIVIGLAMALSRLWGRSRHPLSIFYLAVGVLYFLSLLASYWTSPFKGESGLSWYIQTSIFRIVPGGLGFICLAAILHMSNATLPARAPSDSSRASPPRPFPS